MEPSRPVRKLRRFFGAGITLSTLLFCIGPASCSGGGGGGGGDGGGPGDDGARPDVSKPDGVAQDAQDAPDVLQDAMVADASDASDAGTPDAGEDAADDAGQDAGSDASDAGSDAATDPLCDVPAADFDPGGVCGVGLDVTVACTHTVRQTALTGGCCVPKNPGVACVPLTTLPDTRCCQGPGLYCGLVSESAPVVPITLTLHRGARTGTGLCAAGMPTPSQTKVTVTKPATPEPGINLALTVYEKPACSGGGYTAMVSRTDTTDQYVGRWNDHYDVSQNRDSSGVASVTMNGDGSITYEATGTLLQDSGTPTARWRRTNVGTCAVTFTPFGTTP